jgi:hypothetical protein
VNSVLENYQVKFDSDKLKSGFKSISTSNEWLSQFIDDHYTISETDRLLSGIKTILAEGHINGGGFPSQSYQLAIINNSVTKIFIDLEEWEEDNNIIPAFTLPTNDFKIILEAWREQLSK